MSDSPPSRRRKLLQDDHFPDDEDSAQDQVAGTTFLMIPSSLCGLIRGKNSSTIRDFKERSGVKAAKFLAYANSNDGCVPNSSEQVLRIFGTVDTVVTMIGIVQQTFYTHGHDLENYQDNYSLMGSHRKKEIRLLTVNQICAGIVGTRGQIVKDIEASTGAEIIILPRKGVVSDLVNEKVIVIKSGNNSMENIKEAARKVLTIIFNDRFAEQQDFMPLADPFQFKGGPPGGAPLNVPPLMPQGNFAPPQSMGQGPVGPISTSMPNNFDLQQNIARQIQNDDQRRRENQLLESMLTDEQYQLFTTTGRPAFSRSLLDSLRLFQYSDQDLREVGAALECVAKASLILDTNMQVLARHNLGGLALAYAAGMSNHQAIARTDQNTATVVGHLTQLVQRQPDALALFSRKEERLAPASQPIQVNQLLSRYPVRPSSGHFNEPVYSTPENRMALDSERLVNDILKALPQASETKIEIEIPEVIMETLFYDRSQARQLLQTAARVQVMIRPSTKNGHQVMCIQGSSKESLNMAQYVVRNAVSEEIKSRMAALKYD